MMHDSGQRQSFSTGAVRDTATDKPRIDLISPFALRRLGDWLRRGAEKYAERNWEKGMPISRCVASLCRHVEALKAGETNEDHAAAVMFNAMAVIHYREMIARGVLPAELDDMPKYIGTSLDDAVGLVCSVLREAAKELKDTSTAGDTTTGDVVCRSCGTRSQTVESAEAEGWSDIMTPAKFIRKQLACTHRGKCPSCLGAHK